MDAATKIDVALARLNLQYKVEDVLQRVQDEEARNVVRQWLDNLPQWEVAVPYMSLHPNDDMREMYIQRQEAHDIQTPVFLRTMTPTALYRIRRKMRLTNHPWHGCALEWVDDDADSGKVAVYLNAHPSPDQANTEGAEVWR